MNSDDREHAHEILDQAIDKLGDMPSPYFLAIRLQAEHTTDTDEESALKSVLTESWKYADNLFHLEEIYVSEGSKQVYHE